MERIFSLILAIFMIFWREERTTETKFGEAKLKMKLAKYRYYWACEA
jgi:hypothetical protein